MLLHDFPVVSEPPPSIGAAGEEAIRRQIDVGECDFPQTDTARGTDLKEIVLHLQLEPFPLLQCWRTGVHLPDEFLHAGEECQSMKCCGWDLAQGEMIF